MSPIKVHGIAMSTATARVLAVLNEKEIDFELVPVDMKTGEHKKEPFLSLNPFGQIPAFEDGDLKLFESRAITKYISTEYADKGTNLLCPGSKKTAATLLVALEVESQQFDPIASTLVLELLVKPKIYGQPTDQTAVEENKTKLGKVLDIYETRLTQHKYLVCDCFTLADLHHLPTIHYLMNTSIKELIDARPHVAAWIADISSRPAWAKVIALHTSF